MAKSNKNGEYADYSLEIAKKKNAINVRRVKIDKGVAVIDKLEAEIAQLQADIRKLQSR